MLGISEIARLAAEEARKEQQLRADGGAATFGAPTRKTTLLGGQREKVGVAELSPREIPVCQTIVPLQGPSSLFIFSEDNIIRRHAKAIIDWGKRGVQWELAIPNVYRRYQFEGLSSTSYF